MERKQRPSPKASTQLDERKSARLARPERSQLNRSTAQEHSTDNGSGAIQRASLDPSTMTPQDVQYLQRTMGNAGLTTLLQNHHNGGDGANIQRTPTKINFERSIQRMSDHVDSLVVQGQRMSNSSDSIQRTGESPQSGPTIQRAAITLDTPNGAYRFNVMTPAELMKAAGGAWGGGGTRYRRIITRLDKLHEGKFSNPMFIVGLLLEDINSYLSDHATGRRVPKLTELKEQLKTIMSAFSPSSEGEDVPGIVDTSFQEKLREFTAADDIHFDDVVDHMNDKN
ncbi:MAG: hypothetical protein AAF639_32255, partial [Chloroflexota bacterium]